MTSRAMLLCTLLFVTTTAHAQETTASPPWKRTLKPLRMPKTLPRPVPSADSTAAAPAVKLPTAKPVPRIKYLGSLQRGATRYLFAEVNGQVYSVHTGSELGGLYRLEAIGEREARFVYLPTNENFLVSLN